MKDLTVVVALTTRDNDYQQEQSAAATEAASRLGMKVQIIYADNDAVNQSQQLVKVIQDRAHRPAAILVEPVGTPMPQVAKAAVSAGIAWGVLNREADYISELRHIVRIPIFAISPDQEEVGRIQGRQLSALATEGNILYIEGPSSSSAAVMRTKGMLSTKPSKVEVKILKGDWSEHSAQQAVNSWLALSTSRHLHIQAVVCQNDVMAMGARRVFLGLSQSEREQWLHTPFTGCDGVTKTGREWVRNGQLRATVVIPPMAGLAIELVAKALHSGLMPPEKTLCAPQSLPNIAEINTRAAGA